MKKIIALIASFAFMVGPLRAVSHQTEVRNRVVATNTPKNANKENAKKVIVRRLNVKTPNKRNNKCKVIAVVITLLGGLALGGDYLYTAHKGKGNNGFFQIHVIWKGIFVHVTIKYALILRVIFLFHQ